MMGALHISPDEHLKRVMGNPSDLILKQRELSEATYPLLVSYLGWLRRINAVQNQNDLIRQNKQFLSEFIYLCEHNLLFFLTVTGRFDIIREIFKDKDLLAKEIALLMEIEKEQAQAKAANQQDFLFVPKKTESTTQQSAAPKAPPPPAVLEKSLYGVTNMDLYRYYDAEIKRVTYTHYVKKISLINTVHDSKVVRMQNVLNVIHSDERFSGDTKNKAIALHLEFIIRKEKMNTAYNHVINVDKEEQDLLAVQQLHQDLVEYFKEASDKLTIFLKEFRHINPHLEAFIIEDEEENISTQKTLEAYEQELTTALDDLTSHFEEARIGSMNDIDNGLNLIIEEIKNQLDTTQVRELDDAVLRIKAYKEELKTTYGYDATQELLSRCNKELEFIGGIITPVLPEKSKERFDTIVNGMKQMNVAPQDQMYQLAIPPDISSLLQEGLEIHSETFIPSTSNSVAKLGIEEEPSASNIELLRTKQHPSEVLIGEKTQTVPQIHRYRFFMNSIRDGGEIIEFDPEKQRNYETILKELSNILNDLIEEVEPEISVKIGEIQGLIQDAKFMGFDKAFPSQIQKICDKTSDLGVDDESLNNVKDSLASILQFKDSLQNNIKI